MGVFIGIYGSTISSLRCKICRDKKPIIDGESALGLFPISVKRYTVQRGLNRQFFNEILYTARIYVLACVCTHVRGASSIQYGKER